MRFKLLTRFRLGLAFFDELAHARPLDGSLELDGWKLGPRYRWAFRRLQQELFKRLVDGLDTPPRRLERPRLLWCYFPLGSKDGLLAQWLLTVPLGKPAWDVKP